MQVSNSYMAETSTYWEMIKNVRNEVKLRLITLLSQSISSSINEELVPDKTDLFLDKFLGSWKDNDTAEETIRKINENKSSKSPVSFD